MHIRIFIIEDLTLNEMTIWIKLPKRIPLNLFLALFFLFFFRDLLMFLTMWIILKLSSKLLFKVCFYAATPACLDDRCYQCELGQNMDDSDVLRIMRDMFCWCYVYLHYVVEINHFNNHSVPNYSDQPVKSKTLS